MSDESRYSVSRQPQGVAATLIAILIVGFIGVGLGVLMARITPEDRFPWALVPAWLLIEIVFEFTVARFGGYSRMARVLVAASLLLGFYAAWFVVRSP